MAAQPGTGLVDRVYREILGAIVAGVWQNLAIPAQCSEQPTRPSECLCGPFQTDENSDGLADCEQLQWGDFDLNGIVGSQDLAALLSVWNDPEPPYGDLNHDGVIGSQDLAVLLSRWGTAP